MRNYKNYYLLFSLLVVSLLAYRFTYSFFSDSSSSTSNILAASAVFPSLTPTVTPTPLPVTNTPTPTTTPAVANHVVISEVQINGATANQDFIELYNPTNSAINLSGWQIIKKTSTGTAGSLVLISSGTIPARGYFLWANNQTPQNPFSTTIGADVSNAGNLSENNSIALEDASDNIIDQVGWGTGTNQFVEGTLINNGSDTNKSMERKAYATSTVVSMSSGGTDEVKGNGFDANNNATDFILRAVSQPQNSSSPTEIP